MAVTNKLWASWRWNFKKLLVLKCRKKYFIKSECVNWLASTTEIGKNVLVVFWSFTKGFISGQILKMRSACPHIICQKRLEYYSHLGKEYFSLGKRLMKMIEFCIELMEVLYSPLFYTVWNLQWKAHNSRHKSISSVCWWWKIYWRKQTRTRTLYRMEVGKFSSQETLRGFHNSSRASVWDNRCSILNPLRIFFLGGGGGPLWRMVYTKLI